MQFRWLAFLAVGAVLAGCGEQQAQGVLAEPQVALKATAGTHSPVSGVQVELRPGWNGVGFQATTLTALDSTATGLAFFNGTGYTTGSVNTATINEGQGGRRGFWVFANAAGSLTYSGTGGPDFVELAAGWNLVSFATSAELPGTRLSAQQNGADVPLNQAVLTTFNEIQPDGSYRPVDVTAGGVLQPGRPAWVFAAAATRLVVSQPAPAPSPSPTTGSPSLTLTPAHPSIQVFSYVQLTASGASGPLEWSSSVPSVAAVDSQGLVRGLNKGLATVTATDSAGQSAQTNVTVTDVAPAPGPTPATSPTPALFVPSVISRQNGALGAPAAVTDNTVSPSYFPRRLSDDGRYAVFLSNDAALPGGGGGGTQAYRRDRTAGTTELASSHNGVRASSVYEAALSPDGRFVAFTMLSTSDDFAPSGGSGPFTGGSAGTTYVYLRDMNGPTVRLISCAAGQPTVRANSGSGGFETASQPVVSSNGSFVAYRYNGNPPNAVTGPTAPSLTSGRHHIYHAGVSGATPTTRILSVAPTGATGVLEGNANSSKPSISSDGRYVAFHSQATNLIAGATGLGDDVFRADSTAVQADMQLASRVFNSVAPSGASGAQDFPSLSSDGRYVALRTNNQDVYQAGASGVHQQVVRVDLGSGLPLPVILASADTGGGRANADCDQPYLAGGAGYVSFRTAATNLGTPNNGFNQVIRRNLGGTACALVSGLSGTPAGADVTDGCLTADGQQAVFTTAATNLGLNSPPFRYLYHVFLGP